MISRNLSFLLLIVSTVSTVSAHVALLYPPGRTDNDYLFTFDGSCVNDSCDAFCGDPIDVGGVTKLMVGQEITLRWYSPVPHSPHFYRLSLNRQQANVDGNFDDTQNILTTVSAADAAVSSNDGNSAASSSRRNNVFATTVTIPESALENCAGPEPCVLQLFDFYYFVSCANVILTADASDYDEDTTMNTIIDNTRPDQAMVDKMKESTTVIDVEGASFEDYRVTFDGGEPALDPTLTLNRCETYSFVLYAPGHPFVIKTEPSFGMNNTLSDIPGNDGMETGVLEFTVPADAPSVLYYQCVLHPEMLGILNITGEIETEECSEVEQQQSSVDGDDDVEASSAVSLVAGHAILKVTSGALLLVAWIV